MWYYFHMTKFVPGQISFRDPSAGRWPRPGLIEHGSYVTGQPDIWYSGRDPYRGVLGCAPGMQRVATTRCGPNSQTKCVPKDTRWTGLPNYLEYDQAPYRGMLGDLLTDIACNQSQFAADWRNRFGEVMDTTLYVAVGAAAAAGLVGALTKKPLIGILAGGIVGWMAHQSQVATYAEFLPQR